MIDVRRFDGLGHFQNDWLNARHHFSFGHYYDPARLGWGAIRVWNDDEIAPHTGFDPHPHRDMEIITYVRDGAITHKDSLGNEGRTQAGDVQVMSAGTGVVHAEYNREDELTRIFQIWIEPTRPGGPPAWAAAQFPKTDRANAWVTLASGDPSDRDEGALPIRADAKVLGATLTKGQTLRHAIAPGRYAYAALAKGVVEANGETLRARDAIAAREEAEVVFTAREDAEIVLVEAPGQ